MSSQHYAELQGTAALAYAEVLDQSLSHELASSGTGLLFMRKSVQNRSYWYLRQRVGDRLRMYYLGADTPELRSAMERQKAGWEEGRHDAVALQKAVSIALAAGCTGINHRAYRVLSAVAQSGYFRAGGVMVGSHAFLAAGNMLAASWRRDTTVTQDVDLAASDSAMIAMPPGSTPTREVILNSEQGLLEVPMLDPREPSTSFKVRGGDFRVDLLTPQKGKPRATRYVRKIQSYAQPLVYLDYLLEDTQKAVLLHKDGVLVNVPTPARLALHKLVVARRRSAAEAAKAAKDSAQAAQLIACLLDHRPGDLWLALDAARDYPVAAFNRALKSGLKALPDDLGGPLLDYADEDGAAS